MSGFLHFIYCIKRMSFNSTLTNIKNKIITRTVTTNNSGSQITAGSYGEIKFTIPTIDGYTPIGVVEFSPAMADLCVVSISCGSMYVFNPTSGHRNIQSAAYMKVLYMLD